MSASAVRALLGGAIDYAGLFPPASLPMREAVHNFAAYRESADAWALGRFVVPIARLDELREAAAELLPRAGESPWRLSALAGPGAAAEWEDGGGWHAVGAVVEALELRVCEPQDVAAAAARLPAGLEVYYELPIESDPAQLIGALGRAGGRAKVRTGGVTADAFPSAAHLARFVVACARAGVPFKATAGLHHPLRATYRLTYATDSPTAEMFGFLNVLLAAAIAEAGAPEHEVAALLVERDPAALRLTDAGAEWRNRVVPTQVLAATRSRLAVSFGSCSFREPLDELKALGLA